MFLITQGLLDATAIMQGYGSAESSSSSTSGGTTFSKLRWRIERRKPRTIGYSIGAQRFELQDEDEDHGLRQV